MSSTYSLACQPPSPRRLQQSVSGPDWSQEPSVLYRTPKWVAGGCVRKPSYAASFVTLSSICISSAPRNLSIVGSTEPNACHIHTPPNHKQVEPSSRSDKEFDSFYSLMLPNIHNQEPNPQSGSCTGLTWTDVLEPSPAASQNVHYWAGRSEAWWKKK